MLYTYLHLCYVHSFLHLLSLHEHWVVLEAGTTKESKGQRICSRNSIPVEEMDKEIVHYNKHTMIRALAQGWPLGA